LRFFIYEVYSVLSILSPKQHESEVSMSNVQGSKIAGISAKDMAYPLKSSPILRSKGLILPIMKLDGGIIVSTITVHHNDTVSVSFFPALIRR
jgi:hypothetical protein